MPDVDMLANTMDSDITAGLAGKRLLVLAICAALLYWTLEATFDAFVFSSDSFLRQLLNPSLHELWMRSIAMAFIAGLGIIAQVYVGKTGRLNRVLNALRGVNPGRDWTAGLTAPRPRSG